MESVRDKVVIYTRFRVDLDAIIVDVANRLGKKKATLVAEAMTEAISIISKRISTSKGGVWDVLPSQTASYFSKIGHPVANEIKGVGSPMRISMNASDIIKMDVIAHTAGLSASELRTALMVAWLDSNELI